LARDIGEALGGLAHLSGLRRIRTGIFELSQSVGLDAPVEKMLEQMNNFKKTDFGLPVFYIEREQARDFTYGKVIPKVNFVGLPATMPALACFGDEIWAIVDEKDNDVIVKRGFGKQINDLEVL
jgi:tRNA U55 pseudouridine synthase TruB